METEIIDILHLQTYTKRADLRLSLQNRGYYLTDRKLRKAVEILITDRKYAIASSEKGYSLILTAKDLEDAMAYLNNKAYALHARSKCLRENFLSEKLHTQLSLSL